MGPGEAAATRRDVGWGPAAGEPPDTDLHVSAVRVGSSYDHLREVDKLRKYPICGCHRRILIILYII